MTEAGGSEVLGIDIGGSGIKARVVDVKTGRLVTERWKAPTPRPATPSKLVATFAELVASTGWHGPVGATFPGVIDEGVAATANNLHPDWVGVDAADQFSMAVGGSVSVVNDADAAALAEARFGAARGVRGVALVVTLGTGIGTGLIVDGELVPNSELGQIEIDGRIAEQLASAKAKERPDTSLQQWTACLDAFISRLYDLVRPKLIVLGGGISRDFDTFAHLLSPPTDVVPAALRNEAGIVGAAIARVGTR